MKPHTLSILVENKAGVLSRVTGLFSRRGFNIESLAVGPCEEPDMSRITIVVIGDDEKIEQVMKQAQQAHRCDQGLGSDRQRAGGAGARPD